MLKGKDISPYKNPRAKLRNVKSLSGPDGLPSGAIELTGRRNSYVTFPNYGKLDTVNEITITVWVKPRSSGPIFHYKPRTWGGVHLWVVGGPRKRKWFVRFSTRSGKRVVAVRSSQIKMGRWNYLAVTYNKVKGVGTVWRNGFPVAQVRKDTVAVSFQFLIMAILTLTSPIDINVTTRSALDLVTKDYFVSLVTHLNNKKNVVMPSIVAQYIALSFYRSLNKLVILRITIYRIYSINHPGCLLKFWTLKVGAHSRLGTY